MPIDTSIYGIQQPIKMRSPLEALMTTQDMRLRQESMAALTDQRQAMAAERQLKAEAAAREQAEEQALRQRLAQGTPMTFEEMASLVGPERATKIDEGFIAVRSKRQGALASGLGAVDALPAGMRQDAYGAVRKEALSNGWAKADDLPEQYDPGVVQRFVTAALTPEQQVKATADRAAAKKTREVKVRNPDGTETIQIVEDVPNQTFTSAADAPKAGTFEDYLVGFARSLGRTPAQLDPRQKLKAKAEWDAAGRAPAAEKSRIWVSRNNQTIRIAEDEYQPGDLPMSNREQGRPVTSGDAGKIAELKTSLNDLQTLRTELSGADAVGVASRAGAMLPNAVTELTGWGESAKQRQAVIDRVKQVIGKALEGGVLRKEDEMKYAKILPTIGDPPAVAKSKLDGLERALTQRLGVTMSALEDAGYDTSKFSARDSKSDGAADLVYDPKTKTFKKAGG